MTTFVIDTNVLLNILADEGLTAQQLAAAVCLRRDLRFLVTEAIQLDLRDDRSAGRREFHEQVVQSLEVLPLPKGTRRERLAERWLAALFPSTRPDSSNYHHNRRDALHLGAAVECQASFFVTEDKRLRRKAARLDLGILQVIDFKAMLNQIRASGRQRAAEWETDVEHQTAYIRCYQTKDRFAVQAMASDLAAFYPDIANWIKRKLDAADQLAAGVRPSEIVRILIPEVEDQVAGLALYTEKGDGKKVKLGTFYLADQFRALSLGSHLMHALLQQWNKDGVRSVTVTVTKELMGSLRPILERSGFVVVGYAPEEYVTGTCEFVARKRFIREVLDERSFGDFVVNRYLGGLPADVESVDKYTFRVKDCLSGSVDVVRVVRQVDRKDLAAGTSFVCLIPSAEENERVTDSLRLERELFPLEIRWPGRQPFLVPIRIGYATQLFERVDDQLSLFAPGREAVRRLLRPDNFYFKAPDTRIKRGDVVVFYVAGRAGHLVGEAVVTQVDVGDPAEMYERHGHTGVLTKEEVMQMGNRVMAFRFDFVRRYRNAARLTYRYLKEMIPSLNVQSYYAIPYDVLDVIRREGGRS